MSENIFNNGEVSFNLEDGELVVKGNGIIKKDDIKSLIECLTHAIWDGFYPEINTNDRLSDSD